MESYEKLGLFYIGTNQDRGGGDHPSYTLIDSRDLTTHAMCVGMTGSGKTGLGICLLEEAAMDGIPAIIVDPKGDMGNLLLTFPDLLPSDFVPWVHPDEAERSGLTVEQLAEQKAAIWREGLAASMQSGERIRAMRQRASFELYTPGGTFGRPLSLQGMFKRPPAAIMEDEELFQNVVSTTATSLLHLAGVNADPVTSREHVFFTLLIRKAWVEGRDFDLPTLIHWISSPPITSVGVMDIETYFPEKNRFELALRFNNLFASPSFAAFLEGEPLDIHNLLYTPDGRPKISILTISHLPDAERMFFVSLLLNQLVAWMRTEQGTSSLRALFYMDEVFGYFPPIAKPPSKQPLLTLLKTARAYGLGIVLSTQNPGDLDYKGLGNIGTWFVGRLTTERDRKRLLEGMADEAIDGMSSSELEALIKGLEKREFLMRSAGEKYPVRFKTRFCMSYLAGPLTRDQIRRLTEGQRQAAGTAYGASSPAVSTPQAAWAPPTAAPPQPTGRRGAPPAPAGGGYAASAPPPATPPAAPATSPSLITSAAVPSVPTGVNVGFLPGGPNELYRPYLAGYLSIYYNDEKKGIDHVERVSRITPLVDDVVNCDWKNPVALDLSEDAFVRDIPEGARFTPLPANTKQKTTFNNWSRALVDTIWRESPVSVLYHRRFKLYANIGEGESAFKARVTQAAREERDVERDKIIEKYEKKQQALESKLEKAEDRIESTKEQADDAKRQSAISIGSAVLGGLLGRSFFGVSTVSRGATAAKTMSRAKKSSGNVTRAKESLERLKDQEELLNQDLEEDLDALSKAYESAVEDIETVEFTPLKRDVVLENFMLVWIPESVN